MLKAVQARAALVVIGFAMLAGCASSQPTHFYTLFGLADSQEQIDGKPLSLGVRKS